MSSFVTSIFQPDGLFDLDGRLMFYLKTAIGCFALSRLFFDSYYFVRFARDILFSHLKHIIVGPSRGLLEESSTRVWCSPLDIDYMGHMNNGRYNRECDFGRRDLMIGNGLFWLLRTNKITAGLAATTIRFRKSINFLWYADLKSKIVYWDTRSFYMEQTFYRPSDSFVFATLYAKITLVNSTCEEILNLYGFVGTRPELSPDLESWIKYNEQSSERLRPKAL